MTTRADDLYTIDPAFRAWLKEADEVCVDIAGVGIHDIADQPFRDWFADGLSPEEAVQLALEDEGFPFE
jgi:hypothetical protein